MTAKPLDTTRLVKQWEWMSSEEQADHLIRWHGYDTDYFREDDEDNTEWSESKLADYFSSQSTRDEYHGMDHEENDFGGGTAHEHSLVAHAEVEAAIQSIKEVLMRG